MSDLTDVEETGSETASCEKNAHHEPPKLVSFEPGSVLAFVRWTSNDFGIIFSRIDILRAVAEGERYPTVPGVRPGGEILLRLAGWRKVVRVLEAIDIVEAAGD